MMSLPCTIPSIRFQDGHTVSFNELLALGQPGVVELASATLLPDTPDEVIADLASLPQTIGDDTLDVLVGAYNIAKNIKSLAYPCPYQFTDSPAIVVGSGPSLMDYLPAIAEDYGKYLIVASASAVKPLIDHGIVPHVVAPKERTFYPDWCFKDCPDSVLYAGLHVVPGLAHRFTNQMCVGDGANLAVWSDTWMPYAPGPTSGTHAMGMALAMTSGPVFLVGMDNCGGHYTGYAGNEHRMEGAVLCYDGEYRQSNWLYRVARANMAHKHQGRCYNVATNAAMVDGIPLYDFISVNSKVVMPQMHHTMTMRYDDMRQKLKRLPQDLDTFYGISQSAHTIQDTHLHKMDSPNKPLFMAMMAPTIAQLSMERRIGLSDADVLEWYREATRNIIDMIAPTFNEMATMGGHYE